MSIERDINLLAIRAAVQAQSERVTPGIADMVAYQRRQVADDSHREVLGPLLAGSGASGVVLHAGETLAAWGDPDVPEMLFSATKSLLSTVAGLAFDRGLLADLDHFVFDSVALPELASGAARRITWRHLLQQTSGWDGVLWDKPASVDAQSRKPGSSDDREPGRGWAYNDVRVNLLALALTVLHARDLEAVLREHVLGPLGASETARWHGYSNSFVDIAGRRLKVVSGGAHWGGGAFMSARDLALVGQLYLQRGRFHGRQLLSEKWIELSFEPCARNPDYGLLFWRNDFDRIFPGAPATGRVARGNGGKHLLWIDPARDVVVTSHWGDDPGALLRTVSASIPARRGEA